MSEKSKIEILEKEISRLEKVRDRFMCFDMDDMAQLVTKHIKSLESEIQKLKEE